MPPLTHLEVAVLISVIRLGADAYGIKIHDDVEGFIGRPVSVAAIYAVVERLKRRALLRTTVSEPMAVQGGRSKRLYEITSSGRTWLKHEEVEATRLWQALPARLSKNRR